MHPSSLIGLLTVLLLIAATVTRGRERRLAITGAAIGVLGIAAQ